MSRARSLSDVELERLGAAVDGLMAEYGTQAKVAAALTMPDGGSVSAQSVSHALRREHVRVTFARAVACKLGIPVEDLLTGVAGRANGTLRYKDLPGWAEAAHQATVEELLPRYVIAAAGESLVSFPVRQADVALVVDQGMLWIKHAPLDIRKAAEKVEILAERAQRAAREDQLYGSLYESEGLARGSDVGPVPRPLRVARGR